MLGIVVLPRRGRAAPRSGSRPLDCACVPVALASRPDWQFLPRKERSLCHGVLRCNRQPACGDRQRELRLLLSLSRRRRSSSERLLPGVQPGPPALCHCLARPVRRVWPPPPPSSFFPTSLGPQTGKPASDSGMENFGVQEEKES